MFREYQYEIDRSKRRRSSFLSEKMLEAAEFIRNKHSSHGIQIVPICSREPSFMLCDTKKFLAVRAINVNGLTLYETEYWLDNLALRRGIHFAETRLLFIDKRRMYYQIFNSPVISNQLVLP